MSDGLINKDEDQQSKFLLATQKDKTVSAPVAQLDEEEQRYADNIRARVEREQEVLRQSLMQSVNKNPDQVAQIEKLAQQTGIPQAVVERNLAKVVAEKRTRELEETARMSPILARQLSDPTFASVAYDDTQNLSGMEFVLTKGRDWAGSLGKGAIGQGAGSVLSGFGELYGVAVRRLEGALDQVLPNSAMSFLRKPVLPWYLAPEQVLKRPGQQLKEFGKTMGAPEGRRGLDTDVIEGIGQLGFQIAAFLTTGGTISSTMMYGQGADIMADKTRKDDATQAQKDAAIVTGAGVTALAERYGLNKILEKIPADARNRTLRFIGDKIKAYGQEFGQEVVEGLLHDITRRVATNENAPILEGALEEGNAAGLAAAIVRSALGVRGFKQARDQEQFFRALADNSANSKLRERLPEKFQDLVRKMSESGPVQNVYIPADQFRTYYQSQGIDPAAKAAELNAKNYDEAAAAGTDLVIPIEAFTTTIAPSDDLQALMPDLRLTQGDMTAREYEEYKAEEDARLEEIKQRAREIVGEVQTPEFDQVKQSMMDNLVATGYEQTTADAYATVYAKTITNLAERSGMSALALHEKYDLSVTRPLPEVLTRNTRSDINIDPLLDRLRAGDVPSQQQIYGKSLTDFLIEKGGLTPVPELQDFDSFREKGSRRLLKPGGLSIDEAAMLAAEAGYLGGKDAADLTESDLYDALLGELGGQPAVSFQEMDENLGALADQLNNLNDYLQTLGIDLAQITDNAEVRRLIDQASQDPEIRDAFDMLFQAAPAEPALVGENEGRVLKRDIDNLNEAEQAAFDDFLASRPDAQRIIDNLTKFKGTPFAAQAMEGIFVRQAMRTYLRGETPAFESSLASNQVRKVRETLQTKGEEGLWQLLEVSGGLMGAAAKPVNNINSSFINCDPSPDCAKYCYATVGNYRYANVIVKSELVTMAVELDPARAAQRVAAEYRATAEFANNKALRLFDKGDGSEAWLPFIKELNKQGIRTQIFSKVPEFLRQVPDMNLRLLSIDNSNMEMADANPDLPVAFVYTGRDQVDFLAKLAARNQIQVVLPVKLGRNLLDGTQITDLKKAVPAVKPYLCPIDAGFKKLGKTSQPGTWNCTSCDRNGGVGCFHGNATKQVMQSLEVKPVTPQERAQRILELRRQINELTAGTAENLAGAGRIPQDRVEGLLGEVDALLGELLVDFDGGSTAGQALSIGSGTVEPSGGAAEPVQPGAGRRVIPITRLGQPTLGAAGAGEPADAGDVNEVVVELPGKEAQTIRLFQDQPADDYQKDLFGKENPDFVKPKQPRKTDQEILVDYAQEAEIVEVGTKTIPVETVNSYEEAAAALAYLGRGAVEHFDALVTDSSGKPLAVVGSFKGGVSQASVYETTLAMEAFSIPGAANIWLAHNHPSGTQKFSQADYKLHASVAKMFDGSGIQVRGHFAIGRTPEGEAGFVYEATPGGGDVVGAISKSDFQAQVPVVDRMLKKIGTLGPAIGTTIGIAQVAEKIGGGNSGIMMLNTKNEPIAFVNLNNISISTLRGTGKIDSLMRAAATANATAVILVNAGNYSSASMMNMAGFFNAMSIQTLDIVDIPGNTSFRTQGKSLSSSRFKQGEGMADKRGFIQFGPERKFKIALLEKADLSTFLHESGHFYLEVLGDLAAMPEANQQIKDDYATILKFLNLESREQLSLDGKTPGSAEYNRAVEAHEKFARANEAYLMEGKAPSQELRGIFQRFRSWLKLIYRELTKLNVELNDNIRRVFDRVYATDEEIEAAKAEMSFDPLFLDATAAGMTEAEFEAYQQSVAQATESGKEALQQKLMKEMMREREAWWKEESAKVREEVAAEVDATPVYAAFKALTEGDIKLNKDELVDRYGLDYTKRLPRGFQRVYTTGDGMPLDAAARLLNFPSGDALMEALVGMRPRNDYIKAETDRVMKERYGDIMTDGSISEEAKIALHNSQREKVLAAELRALRRKQREVAPFLAVERQRQAAERRAARAAIEVPPIAAFREAAKGMIGQTAIRDLEPQRYLNAQRKEGKRAMKAMADGDYATAADAKQREMLNHFLYLEARNAKDKADKIAAYMRKFERKETRQRIGKAGKEYLEQIDAILDSYEFKRLPNKTIDRRASLNSFVAKQEEAGEPVNIPVSVLEDARQINYRLLSVDELNAVNETVRNIANLASLKNKLTLIAEKRSLDEVAGEAIEHVLANSGGGKAKKIETALPGEQLGRWAKGFMLIHKKFATFFRQMDGWQDGGMMWNLFVRPLNDRADYEAVQRAEATKKLRELFKPYRDANMFKKTYIEALGQGMTLQGRLMVALNWGREENRQRLMDGNGFTQAQIDGIFATLDERDWQFVQGVWDYIDSYWPQISEQYEKLYGVPPEKSDAAPFETKYGPMRGGYFPIKYDPIKSTQAQAQTVEDVSRLMKSGAYVRSQTKNGFTKEVLENLDRAVKLDFSTIYEHVNEVIHDLAMREYLLDTNKLLNHRVDGRTLKDTINDVYGDQAYREIVNTIRDVAAGDIGATNSFDQALGHVRAGVSIIGMGWNLMTGMMQPLGLTQSFVRVGPKWVAKGLFKWGSDAVQLQNSAKVIYEKSAFMRTRQLTQNREINEIRNQIKRQGKFPIAREAWGVVEDSYFQLIIQGQKLVDIPTWLGAYEKALAFGADEARAVALADQAVIDAQGGGAIKDLASVQRGSQLMKIWTNFYSYFNTTFNLTLESFGKTNFKNPIDIGRLGVDMLMLYTVPAVLGFALREAVNMAVGGDEPDEEELIDKLLREQLTYMMGTMVGLREFATIFDPRFGYSGPAGVRFIAEVERLGTQISQGELDDALRKAALNVSGMLLHFPAGQVNRIIDGIYALEEGEGTPAAVIFGAPK